MGADILDAATRSALEDAGIDVPLTTETLMRIRRGAYTTAAAEVRELPEVDGNQVVDAEGLTHWRVSNSELDRISRRYGLTPDLLAPAERTTNETIFDRRLLRRIGLFLIPRLSYGVLNGGSATSYGDLTKNRGFDEAIFRVYESAYNRLAPVVRGTPKGTVPAFYHEDLSPGPSFLELKMRSILGIAAERRAVFGASPPPDFPMFQMTSVSNNREIEEACAQYASSPVLSDLIADTRIEITRVLTGVQPMIAAFTHSESGEPREVFLSDRLEHGVLPLPGGHGQSFSVLSELFLTLHSAGVEFVQLCNVDNLGSTIDPVSIALLALSPSPAAFDFSYRTPVDIKGGVLVRTSAGRLDCADIGPAISFDGILSAEAAGKRVLFNCANGLFKLPELISSLETIKSSLPLRVTDQDKDAGRYAQAEQITWEVIGLLDHPLIFAVSKTRRFLAAKLLIETLMTSGLGLSSLQTAQLEDGRKASRTAAFLLHEGLVRRLSGEYRMHRVADRWVATRPDG